ncbi:hypothetical protein [Tolypothrix bouteillei]|nr:hypothetical protein [Tolypothrix bouteillei]
MPETNAPKMTRIEFAIPEPILKQALEIAEADGWKPAEFYRILWFMGLNAYTETANSRLINSELRKNQTQEEQE